MVILAPRKPGTHLNAATRYSCRHLVSKLGIVQKYPGSCEEIACIVYRFTPCARNSLRVAATINLIK